MAPATKTLRRTTRWPRGHSSPSTIGKAAGDRGRSPAPSRAELIAGRERGSDSAAGGARPWRSVPGITKWIETNFHTVQRNVLAMTLKKCVTCNVFMKVRVRAPPANAHPRAACTHALGPRSPAGALCDSERARSAKRRGPCRRSNRPSSSRPSCAQSCATRSRCEALIRACPSPVRARGSARRAHGVAPPPQRKRKLANQPKLPSKKKGAGSSAKSSQKEDAAQEVRAHVALSCPASRVGDAGERARGWGQRGQPGAC